MHINTLRKILIECLNIDVNDKRPFVPRYEEVLGTNQNRAIEISKSLALCKNSCMLCELPFTNTFNEVIYGINVSIIFITKRLRGDFVSPSGKELVNRAFFKDHKILLYNCDKQLVYNLLNTLHTEKLPVIYVENYIHISSYTEVLNFNNIKAIASKNTEKRRKACK